MRGIEQQCIGRVAQRGGKEDAQPRDAGAKQAAGKNAEKYAKNEIAEEVAHAGMQRESRDRAPPFAFPYQRAVDAPGSEPVCVEEGIAGEPGNGANDENVGDNAG